MALTVYGCPFVEASSFKYLGQVLSVSNSDWPEVNWNLRKDAAEMGAVVTGAWTGGGGYTDVGNVLHCSG